MKKLIIVIISLSLIASCTILKGARLENEKTEQRVEPKPLVVEIKKPSVGDRVVARWGTTSWAEGRVESIEKDRAQVVWAEDDSKSEVELKEVFLRPSAGSPVTVKPGDFTVVKSTGNWWQEAEIKEVGDGVIKAKGIYGNEMFNVLPDQVLTISPIVAEDLKDAAEQQNFLNKAQQRHPLIPGGYKPQVGDRVLAPWTSTSWYPGKVKSVSEDKAMIVWESGMTPDQVSLDKVVPFPTAETLPIPAANDFVLLKPTGGAWIYGQVTKVNGSTVEAKSIDSTREYQAGEYIVLR